MFCLSCTYHSSLYTPTLAASTTTQYFICLCPPAAPCWPEAPCPAPHSPLKASCAPALKCRAAPNCPSPQYADVVLPQLPSLVTLQAWTPVLPCRARQASTQLGLSQGQTGYTPTASQTKTYQDYGLCGTVSINKPLSHAFCLFVLFNILIYKHCQPANYQLQLLLPD